MYVVPGVEPVVPAVQDEYGRTVSVCEQWDRIHGFPDGARAWWRCNRIGVWFWEPPLPKVHVLYVTVAAEDHDVI